MWYSEVMNAAQVNGHRKVVGLGWDGKVMLGGTLSCHLATCGVKNILSADAVALTSLGSKSIGVASIFVVSHDQSCVIDKWAWKVTHAWIRMKHTLYFSKIQRHSVGTNKMVC